MPGCLNLPAPLGLAGGGGVLHLPTIVPVEADSVEVQPGPGSASVGSEGRGVSWRERLRKVTRASSLYPRATHTMHITLGKHTHKSTLWLGLQTPPGPPAQP